MPIRVSRNRVDLEGARLDDAVLKAYGETLVGGVGGTNTGSSYTIDLSTGNVFHLVLSANCTFTFSNPNASGTATSFVLILRQDSTGSRTVTWPSAVVWSEGTAPTLTTTASRTDILTFTTFDGGAMWIGMASGADFNRIVQQGLWAWGNNSNGQLGLNDTTNRSSPAQVSELATWASVSAGSTSLARKTDGTLWAWGPNAQGQLGLGDTANRSSPVQVGALTTWSSASVGNQHTLALKTDGTLWAWGYNGYGRLGVGDTANRSSPVQVGALTTWSSASAGRAHSLALKTDGTLWAWGYNGFAPFGGDGRLGLGDGESRSSPVQVGALTTWSSVSAGIRHSLAVKTDGTLWAWGYNAQGQLGLGDTADRSSPVQVGALTTWSSVSAATTYNTLALKTDGTLWAWGQNSHGQLGLGDTASRSSPVQVGALTTWSSVSAGEGTSFSIKTDGTLWAWGRGSNGYLGLGDTVSRSSPVQVGTFANWTDVSPGGSHSLAIQDLS